MNSPDNQPSSRRGTITPSTSTPDHYPHQDHSFTLQMIMELQRSVGQLSESIANTHKHLDRLEHSVENRFDRAEDKTENHFDALEDSMSSVKLTIGVAAIILTIVVAISGFFVDKVWDAVSNHIEISVKK